MDVENEGRDDRRKDRDYIVAHPGYKLHRIGTNGRACGGYLPVVARKADDDDDDDELIQLKFMIYNLAISAHYHHHIHFKYKYCPC